VDRVRDTLTADEGAGERRPRRVGIVDGRQLARAAELHGVEGWVRRAVDPDPDLDRAVHAALARHLRALGDLRLAGGALARGGVPFLVVKGPALVATCYASPDLRSYVDLDLLVRPGDVGAAVRCLESAGCLLLDANWPLLTGAAVHELRLGTPAGGALDLHWSLGAGPVAGDASPSVVRLMARSVEIDCGGLRVGTLGAQDTLLHVAVHAAAAGGHRLIWLADLRGALARALEGSTSGAVLAVADEWQARPALALMLRRAERWLGLETPPELRRLVRPGPWTALVAIADRLSPPPLVGTGTSISRLVARSCRESPRASLAAAAGKSWAWWHANRSGGRPPGDLLNPDDPGSALYPSGGPGGRQAFFDHVAGSADGRGP